jgi:hypothetical protein
MNLSVQGVTRTVETLEFGKSKGFLSRQRGFIYCEF